MKKDLLILLIIVIHICAGCGNCGKDVNIGNFELSPQSIEDWYPYIGINELTFKNSEGDIVTMQIEEQNNEMINNVVRDICRESELDNAQEYFLGESLYVTYQGVFNEINYSVSILLSVMQIYSSEDYTELRLLDNASYSYTIFSDKGYLIGSISDVVVNYRNNTIPDNGTYESPDYASEIEINGIIYKDVWYFVKNGIPSLYIQQGEGIIAFLGLDGTVWTLI